MVKNRLKLVIRDPGDLPVEDLEALLREHFDVTVLGPEDAASANGDTSAVVISAGDVDGVSSGDAGALLDAIGEGVCLADTQGRAIWCNNWFAQLSRSVRADLSLFCREASRWFKTNSPDRPRRFELSEPGGERIFDIEMSPVPEDKGVEARMALVVRDVTQARRHRQKLEALERAGTELIKLEREQLREMNMIERLALLERKIIKFAHDLLRFDNFTIWLKDEKTGRLECVMSRGLPAEIRGLQLRAEQENNGICGWVALHGRSYICNDTENDRLFLPGMANARSSLTVPLRLLDQVIGVMDIESAEANAFSDQDRQFAELFARHVALALHMLDALVVERSATSQSACDRVEGELSGPLDDIIAETDAAIREVRAADDDPEMIRHLTRIRDDVDAIRTRMRNVAAGPQTLLGVDRAMAVRERDPVLAGKRVLVADDEQKIRRVLGDVLRHRGCEVSVCADGGKAIEELERVARGELESFDLVISDIKMPDRNGYEVFSAARKAMGEVPVILMTGFGYDPHHSIVRASQEGLQAVLFKPFQIERMVDEVRKALAETPRPEA